MNITVINGTSVRGVTYKLKELFLEPFRDEAQITEFYLPKDCPDFCVGCKACFLDDEHKCKDSEYIQKIEKAMLSADLLVFTSPAYVMHTTGAMKAMLDHFGYRWMPHRPAKEMFGKRAVIITQCLGAGDKSAAKDIKDSLSWWGISSIKVIRFRFLGDVKWERIADKKRRSMEDGVKLLALKMKNIDYSKPAHTKLAVKFKFLAVKSLQADLGKDNLEYRDFKYWKEQGWLDKKRPWK